MGRADKLYLPNGYLDMNYIIESMPTAIIIVCGGRGTGKTYGALTYVAEHKDMGTIFLRITDVEHDLISDQRFSPFKWHNRDNGWNIQPFHTKKGFASWFDAVLSEDGEKLLPTGEEIMLSTSLTKIASIRGFSADDYGLLILDECIPERGKVSRMKDDTFANAYETINRNRELMGELPIKALLLSNSNQLDNPIFRGFNLVEKAEAMKRKGQTISIMKDREITLIVLPETEVSRKKRETAIYKATRGTEFESMAIDNDFAYDKPSKIESKSLSGYKPLYCTKDFAVYTSSSDWFVSKAMSRHMQESMIGESMPEIIKARRDYDFVWEAYCEGLVYFETYGLELLFRKFYLDNVRNL